MQQYPLNRPLGAQVSAAITTNATTAGATTATQMAQITTTDVHVNLEGKPFFNGLVVNPGTGGVVAVYYDPAYITPPLNITN